MKEKSQSQGVCGSYRFTYTIKRMIIRNHYTGDAHNATLYLLQYTVPCAIFLRKPVLETFLGDAVFFLSVASIPLLHTCF